MLAVPLYLMCFVFVYVCVYAMVRGQIITSKTCENEPEFLLRVTELIVLQTTE